MYKEYNKFEEEGNSSLEKSGGETEINGNMVEGEEKRNRPTGEGADTVLRRGPTKNDGKQEKTKGNKESKRMEERGGGWKPYLLLGKHFLRRQQVSNARDGRKT